MTQLDRIEAKLDRLLAKGKKGPDTAAAIIEEMAECGAYQGIDIGREWAKMAQWCAANGKLPSKRRFINWLNRCDQPISRNAPKDIGCLTWNSPPPVTYQPADKLSHPDDLVTSEEGQAFAKELIKSLADVGKMP